MTDTIQPLFRNTYLACDIDEVGPLPGTNRHFNATSWADAERVCAEKGWVLIGQIGFQAVGAGRRGSQVIDLMNERERSVRQ